ncbi:hypothetical protein O6H91_17G011100 [Diphasiastrum complanatum]|uniref:Uncharacterized protein n=1 Tax=Diphasiastrum complanatum TaxID=34168 RepID=A0ACC2B449_DIPCM|nr:hypothetical protein O6H91_17G011100 [Diphasiastrum complanatum]
MGSLMAGWDSPRLRSRTSFERSSSLTRVEIKQYRKDHNQPSDEEKAKQMSELGASSGKPQIIATAAGAQVHKWNVSPHGVIEIRDEIPKTQHNDWWKKTNYAYLNDRPVELRNTKAKNSKLMLAQNPAGEISPVVLIYNKSMPSSSTSSPCPCPSPSPSPSVY